ncbi:hypothetical protein SNL152K_5446 [Streptomyces sp. NL15-2K]|nr:hypothetical protein SNL152K_5446 [Streptomyces sp. NL15-2K]
MGLLLATRFSVDHGVAARPAQQLPVSTRGGASATMLADGE